MPAYDPESKAEKRILSSLLCPPPGNGHREAGRGAHRVDLDSKVDPQEMESSGAFTWELLKLLIPKPCGRGHEDDQLSQALGVGGRERTSISMC